MNILELRYEKQKTFKSCDLFASECFSLDYLDFGRTNSEVLRDHRLRTTVLD